MRYKSVCSYEWPYGEGDGEGEDEIYDTVEFKDEESIADPLYNYKQAHTILLTEDQTLKLRDEFLGINVYGKSKGKRKKEDKKPKEEKKEFLYEIEGSVKESTTGD